ncbi:MAG: heme-copper oxidase subunit III [Planctomycetota bacterium]
MDTPANEGIPPTSQVWPPVEKGQSVPGAGPFGMVLFLVSLTVSFLAVLVAYAVFRVRGGSEWLPADKTGLPDLLWVSNGLIVGCSGAAQWALIAVRNDRRTHLLVALVSTLLLALGFTVCQGFAWREIAREQHLEGMRIYSVTFYLLTGLHALHVIGGFGLQAWVVVRASLRHYWSLFHPGVLYAAMYWHFLGAVWFVLFAVLWSGSQ